MRTGSLGAGAVVAIVLTGVGFQPGLPAASAVPADAQPLPPTYYYDNSTQATLIYPTILSTTAATVPQANEGGYDVVQIVTNGQSGWGASTTVDLVCPAGGPQPTVLAQGTQPTTASSFTANYANSTLTLLLSRPADLSAAGVVDCNLMIDGGMLPRISTEQLSFTPPGSPLFRLRYAPDAPALGAMTPHSYGQAPTSPLRATVALNGAATLFPYTATQVAPGYLPAPSVSGMENSSALVNCLPRDTAQWNSQQASINPSSVYAPGNGTPVDADGGYTAIEDQRVRTFVANGVQASTCDLVLPVTAADGGAAGQGFDVLASVNASSLPAAILQRVSDPTPAAGSGGFTWVPPYQGPVSLVITNNSDIADDQLHLGLVGASGPPASGSGQGGVTGNWKTYNDGTFQTLLFTDAPGYDATRHSATLSMTPAYTSGDLLFLQYLDGEPGTCYQGDCTAKPPTNKAAFVAQAAPGPSDPSVRFALAEFSYTTTALDVDLSLVDQYGISMTSTLSYQGNYLQNSYEDTGCFDTVTAAVQQVASSKAAVTKTHKDPKTKLTSVTGVVSPGKLTAQVTDPTGSGVVNPSLGYGAMTSYATWVRRHANYGGGTTGTTQALHINDILGNSPKGSGQNGTFDYTATYITTATTVGGVSVPQGYWALTGTIGGTSSRPAVPGPLLLVEHDSLAGAGTHGGTAYSIYGQDGPFKALVASGTVGNVTYKDVYGSPAAGWANDGGPLMNGGPCPAGKTCYKYTNMLKTIFRDFITPFANGLWGSPNPSLAGTPPRWSTGDQTAYMTVNPRTSSFGNAWGTSGPPAKPAWDVYQQAIVNNTNLGFDAFPGNTAQAPNQPVIYGMAYGDTMLPPALSPNFATPTADNWAITLGDPPYCAKERAVLPANQDVRATLGTALTALDYSAGAAPAADQMMEYQPVNFPAKAGSATYTLLDSSQRPVPVNAEDHQVVNGLVLDAATGALSGMPTATQPATTYFIKAVGSGDQSVYAIAPFTLTVKKPLTAVAPKPSLAPASQVVKVNTGTPIVTAALSATGFAGPVTYAITPALPSDLVLDVGTGEITGTPTVRQSTVDYTIRATDASSTASATAAVSIAVANPAPPPAPLGPTNLGGCFPTTQTVTGTVGNAITPTSPLSIPVAAPVFVQWPGTPDYPPGITGPTGPSPAPNSDGTFSGTPTVAGTTTVIVRCQGIDGYNGAASVTFNIS